MNIVTGAKLVITDSGGLQEETTYLGIPCLTLRENTERPITVSMGTNRLTTAEQLQHDIKIVLSDDWPQGERPPLWDGKTAGRAVEAFHLPCADDVHSRAHGRLALQCDPVVGEAPGTTVGIP